MGDILTFIQQNLAANFPGIENQKLGSFFFLRLVCPMITSPEEWGMTVEGQTPSPAARRIFILIAKVLQNLANNVLFGRKEKYLTCMNQFLQSNEESVNQLYENLCQPAENAQDLYDQYTAYHGQSADSLLSDPFRFPEEVVLKAQCFIVDTITSVYSDVANFPILTPTMQNTLKEFMDLFSANPLSK